MTQQEAFDRLYEISRVYYLRDDSERQTGSAKMVKQFDHFVLVEHPLEVRFEIGNDLTLWTLLSEEPIVIGKRLTNHEYVIASVPLDDGEEIAAWIERLAALPQPRAKIP